MITKFFNSILKAASTAAVVSFLLTVGTNAAFADDISLAEAKEVIAAAQAKAEEQGTLMNIAVVDSGANLVAFVRMDGSFLGSIDISIAKARTSRLFNMPTGTLGTLSQPGGPLYNIELSNDSGLISFAGGVPLKDKDGNIVGGIGVSGDTVENDLEVAEAGAAVLVD